MLNYHCSHKQNRCDYYQSQLLFGIMLVMMFVMMLMMMFMMMLMLVMTTCLTFYFSHTNIVLLFLSGCKGTNIPLQPGCKVYKKGLSSRQAPPYLTKQILI
jgi:hypothetical protein